MVDRWKYHEEGDLDIYIYIYTYICHLRRFLNISQTRTSPICTNRVLFDHFLAPIDVVKSCSESAGGKSSTQNVPKDSGYNP